MSNKIWIYTGNRPSNSAKVLCETKDFKRLRHKNLKSVKPEDIVINWGTTDIPIECKIINAPNAVKVAINKLETFKLLRFANITLPEWTPKQEIAQSWSDNNNFVVVRNKLTGHSGDGILIVEKQGQVPEAPLYTKYVFKIEEYRVHVFDGVVIDTVKKVRDPNKEVLSWKIRSHDNGFMFTRNTVEPEPTREYIAINTIKELGLDFGAVDIMVDKNSFYYVLEVNTAPGLIGQTIENYRKAFNGLKS